MDFETITSIATLLVSSNLLTGWATRRATRRRMDAEAEQQQFAVWRDQLTEMHNELTFEREHNRRLMEQNISREERFVEQTARLREAQNREYESTARVVQLTEETGQLRLRLAEHECVNLSCPLRTPPNHHTLAARATNPTAATN